LGFGGQQYSCLFIQDAIKFPDLIHSVKPEPHNGMPQAGSAHDTFWDFASLMPETMHTIMWVMSDRGIPRSLRMMQGFGVHTFRLVNAQGVGHFVKFHWQPKLGTHSLVWDEAGKLSGADSDFHRRDLWDAIAAGEYPEWELNLQIFTEAQAQGFSFDVLDATKIIPVELVPLRPVGRMVLNRNPDNFFAETEQVAFCTANIVPGIDFSNDPLLAGRNHSYVDTQISRLGGVNFHEIPINAPRVAPHNNQRDGIHRITVPQGRVSYEPNSLGGGCPFQAGAAGFTTFAQGLDPNATEKLRAKPEKFKDHYTQASLFYESQTAPEKAHIAAAFRFELSKLGVVEIQLRVLASLRNVSQELASTVAQGLGLALPKALEKALAEGQIAAPEVRYSPSLSLTALPGDGGIRTRKIAILVADGAVGESVRTLTAALHSAGAVPLLIAPRLGRVNTSDGEPLHAQGSLENSPGVLFDALVLADGQASVQTLRQLQVVQAYIFDQYQHGKTIMALGVADTLLNAALEDYVPQYMSAPGLLRIPSQDSSAGAVALIAAVALHRHTQRETLVNLA
jgi:catalase